MTVRIILHYFIKVCWLSCISTRKNFVNWFNKSFGIAYCAKVFIFNLFSSFPDYAALFSVHIFSDYVALYYSNLSIFIHRIELFQHGTVQAMAWHNFDNKKVFFSVFWVHTRKFYAMFVVTFLLGVAWHAIRFVFMGFLYTLWTLLWLIYYWL